jgi:hypothetical protein
VWHTRPRVCVVSGQVHSCRSANPKMSVIPREGRPKVEARVEGPTFVSGHDFSRAEFDSQRRVIPSETALSEAEGARRKDARSSRGACFSKGTTEPSLCEVSRGPLFRLLQLALERNVRRLGWSFSTKLQSRQQHAHRFQRAFEGMENQPYDLQRPLPAKRGRPALPR